MARSDTAGGGRQSSSSGYARGMSRMRRAIMVALAFSAVINMLMLTGSVYMLQVYDRVLASGSLETLAGLFAIVVLLYGFLWIYDALRRRIMGRAAAGLDRAAGAGAFGLWLKSARGGQVAGGGQPLRDLDTVRGFLASPGATALLDLPFVPLFLGVLFVMHPWLGWITAGGAGVAALVAIAGRGLSARALARAAEHEAGERDFAETSRRDAATLAAMGMEAAVVSRWRGLRGAALAANQSGVDPAETLAAFSRAFRMLLQSAILTMGAFLVIRGQLSAGAIVAASILSGRALAPLDQIIGQWSVIGRASAAHARLRTAFAALAATAPAVALPEPVGHLSVSNLSRLAPGAPGTDRRAILDKVTFDLEPGDVLGVFGNSGSGKSTLARMLTGTWAADAGEVRLDGATLDQWDPSRLGRAVGYLPQSVSMLPGTIRDNVSRFYEDATDAQVIAAARLAGVHDMILSLPDGYGTRLGEVGGLSLSGGQMQRLGLARALFGMPRLVILDEPNANLDPEGDAALAEAVDTLRDAGSAVVVIAHRPGTVAMVDKILVLHDGRVLRFDDKSAFLADHQRAAANSPSPARGRTVADAQAGGGTRRIGLVPGRGPGLRKAQSGGRT